MFCSIVLESCMYMLPDSIMSSNSKAMFGAYQIYALFENTSNQREFFSTIRLPCKLLKTIIKKIVFISIQNQTYNNTM